MKMKIVNDTGLANDTKILVAGPDGEEFDLLNACHVKAISIRVEEVVKADIWVDLTALQLVVEGKLVGDPVKATTILDDLSDRGYCDRGGDQFRYVGKPASD